MAKLHKAGAEEAPVIFDRHSLSIGRVSLTARELGRVGAFYEQTVALHLPHRDGSMAEFGVDGMIHLQLRRDASVRRRSPREAGLFHTAFLMPTRGDLARWIRRPLEGVRSWYQRGDQPRRSGREWRRALCRSASLVLEVAGRESNDAA